MARNGEFFRDKKPAAVLKHGILGRYAAVFAAKTGSRHSVTIVDGYAGPGMYDDDRVGSPLILADAVDFAAKLRPGADVRCLFAEAKPAFQTQLRQALAGRGIADSVVLGGTFENHLDEVIAQIAGRAALIFLDPFGTSISFRAMTELLERPSTAHPPREVLLHFSVEAIRRSGRAALSPASPPGLGQRFDRFLGGVWWRAMMADGIDPTDSALKIAAEYTVRMKRATGFDSLSVPVRDRPGHQPRYLLVLFTASHHGLWHFADAAGHGYVDWLTQCDLDDFNAQQLASEQSGVMSLFADFEPRAPDWDEIDATMKGQMAEVVERNLRRLLASAPSVHLGRTTEAVYGAVLGRARERHVRDAVKRMVEAEVIERPSRLDPLVNLTLQRR